MTDKKAVILLSGGLDSATVVAMARAEGYSCYTMSFDYRLPSWWLNSWLWLSTKLLA
jgi:7-cyano-7-deazaguanine synthase in queuosine biosynthesis